ncbi:protein kinase [Streptomyces sp. NPDC048305]|uniref:protein kinase domain-containing protein n=1 Tax=Streptomyces sp. NPDC048305 TaxID=3365532 RepID=UPI0037232C11
MPQQPIAGRYELVEELSSGGMGDVWRGYDAVLDRPVAVKVVRRQAVEGSPQLAEEFAKRFKREARITARIQHPGVPQVFDAVLDDTYERLFLVMELVDGVALSTYIEARPADVQEVYERLRPFLPSPGEDPRPGKAGPRGAPDPTGVFRRPWAPRTRPGAGRPVAMAAGPVPALPAPVAVPEQLRVEIAEAYAHSDALLDEERFAQAAEVLGEIIGPAARALGAENRKVLELRTQRAAIQLLGGDYRTALPEFDALADAYARTGGPGSAQARACRAQAARCRGELGQVTDALAALRGVLEVVRTVDGDMSDEAVELRRDIGMLLLARGEASEAQLVLAPLHEDLCLVYGPEDDMSGEVAEALSLIELDLDGPVA